ncbi:MAG: hypothetical protein IPO92_15715 [Saprospiraceae bacterium]|nr:hypothetical protein [Saprospiraceae bacterium]
MQKTKASCDCVFFTQHKICKHIIGVLFAIRNEIKTKQVTKEVIGEKSKQKLTSLNINQMLDEINHADLKIFVKQYAREDKKFSTQLKVHFARKIDLKDNKEKYKNILNAIIRPNTGQAQRPGSADIRAIVHVLEDFGDQIQDCIALSQYREAFNIYESAFAKLEYVRHHYEYQGDQLKKLSQLYHGIIDDFLIEKIPPELRIELINFLMDLAGRSYYRHDDLENNILNLVLKRIKKQDTERIKIALKELINSRKNKEEIIILLALYLKMQGRFTKNEIVFLAPYSTYLVEIADQLIGNKEETLALKLLEYLHSKKHFDKNIINRLVFLYIRFNNKPKLKECAQLAYIHSGDLKYIDILKRELEDEAYNLAIVIIEHQLSDMNADPSFIIKIYKKDQNWTGLLHFLQKESNIALVQQNDVALHKYEAAGLASLYTVIISEYLDDHLGENAFEYLESIKNHLVTHKINNVILALRSMLKDKYAHRPKLVDIFE